MKEKIYKILKKTYTVKSDLLFSTPLELLVSAILSSRCTDKKVNEVTKVIFKKYKTAEDYAKANHRTFENEIKPTGFYKNKAKNIVNCCKIIVDKFNGNIPSNIDDLTSLAGIGRKTANLILGVAYKKPAIIVDTHVKRVSQKLNLTKQNDPYKIELELSKIIPKENWTAFSLLMIQHGRYICKSIKPLCNKCKINPLCPSKIS